MKTTEIMKIEYLEPVVRVKEVTRRRCVVASNGETDIVSINDEQEGIESNWGSN